MATDKEIEAFLATKMEGKVYCHIWIVFVSYEYFVTKEFYRVENGIVLHMHKDGEAPSGDSLFEIKKDCHLVGKYNPSKSYKRYDLRVSPSELINNLKLTRQFKPKGLR